MASETQGNARVPEIAPSNLHIYLSLAIARDFFARAKPDSMRLLLVLPCVSSFFVGLKPAPAPSARCLAHMRGDPEATRDSEGSYEAYVADRASGKSQYGSIEDAAADFAEFEKYNLDFDGGDSGGGVVGDGNTDLEDQHNSASIVRPKLTQPWPSPQPYPYLQP